MVNTLADYRQRVLAFLGYCGSILDKGDVWGLIREKEIDFTEIGKKSTNEDKLKIVISAELAEKQIDARIQHWWRAAGPCS